MKVLHTETYEREGNDSWLIDKIQIIQEDGELILRHKQNWTSSWADPIKGTREINLSEMFSVADMQYRLNEYMESKGLSENMKVPNLSELINGN